MIRDDLVWRRNVDGMWAWFDWQGKQVTGARGEVGSDRPFAVLDENGHGLETSWDALPGETVAEYVLRSHGLSPEFCIDGSSRQATPSSEITIATHPEFERLQAVYGHLTIPQMDNLIESMQAESMHLLSQHKREFDGNGGRRYGPAMSTQAGRDLGQERLYLRSFRNWKASRLTDPVSAQVSSPEDEL